MMRMSLVSSCFEVSIIALFLVEDGLSNQFTVDCKNVRLGQYICDEADIDSETQQPKTCTKENKALVNCTLVEGLVCKDTAQNIFSKEIPCEFTKGKSFETALLLSIFLGMFGVDRFYLGYPAIGLLKLCTLGFMFLGQLVDIILIATQVVQPADGSNYITSYYGPRLIRLDVNNETFKVPKHDW